MSDIAELRKLSVDKLQDKLAKSRQQLHKMIAEQTTDPGDDVRAKQNLKKDIARMLTIINEKQEDK